MEKFRTIFFVVRHIIGVALFIWLTYMCFSLNTPQLGYLFLVLTPVYAAFAFFSGRSLIYRARQMDKRRAMAAAAASASREATDLAR